MAQRMSADDVYYYANWTLVAALVLGVISTYAIVASGNIRDSALRREVANANARAAEAELVLAKFRTARANLLSEVIDSREVKALRWDEVRCGPRPDRSGGLGLSLEF